MSRLSFREISFCHFHRFSDQNHRKNIKKAPHFF